MILDIRNKTLASAVQDVEGRFDDVAQARLNALTLVRADLKQVEDFLNERCAFFEVSVNELYWKLDDSGEDDRYCFALHGRPLRDLDPVIIHKNIEKNIPPLLRALAQIVDEMREIR